MPPGAIVLSQTRQIDTVQGSEGPEPGLLEGLAAGARVSMDQWTETQTLRRVQGYAELGDALVERGVPRDQLLREKGFLARTFGSSNAAFDYSPELVWQEVERARASDRSAFAGIPKTRDEFEQWVLRRKGARDADQRTLARGGVAATVGSFAGQAASDMADSDLGPLQFMIGGGGRTVAQAFLREGVVASLEEAVKQPERIANRRQLGEQTTAAEVATDIGSTFVFAGLLGAGGKVLGDNWDAIKSAPRDVQERAWAAILDRTPGLRDRVGAAMDWDALDPHLADIAEATIDRTRMTDAERGAIAALRREAATDAGNPFVPDGAGTASHYALLGDTLQGIINESPAYVPKVSPSPAARLRSGTSVASGVTGDAMQTVKARIGMVESGGSATARNPRSSAMGLYQFTDGTWLSYYKARFGAQGLSDAQIIAKKGDTGLQNTLMDDLLADNARALQDAGFAADAGNLYLAHFAGRKGATDLLRADPGASARAVLGDRVIAANPFLARMTAQDMIAWAHGKMGGKAPPAAAGRQADEPDIMAALDRELADTEADLTRLGDELQAGTRGIGEALDEAAESIEDPVFAKVYGADAANEQRALRVERYNSLTETDPFDALDHAEATETSFFLTSSGELVRVTRDQSGNILFESGSQIARFTPQQFVEVADQGKFKIVERQPATEPVPVADVTPLPRVDDGALPPEAVGAEVAGMTAEARAAIPRLRGIAERERDVSLNDPAALSARLGVDERNVQLALQQMAIDGLLIQKRDGSFTRLPQRKDGPMDVLTYIASTGGVTPKGFSQSLMARLPTMENPPKGHDLLGTIFGEERVVRWRKKPTASDPKGVPLPKPRRVMRSKLIPRYGPIVRNSGRGLDEIGEDLFEAGYFPHLDRRPTEAEVLDMLSAAAAGEKFYSINDIAAAADAEAARAAGVPSRGNPFLSQFQSEEHYFFEFAQFDRVADEEFGLALDDELFADAWRAYQEAGDGDERAAVLRAVQRDIDDLRAREIAERGLDDAEDIIAEWEEVIRADGFVGGEEGARPLFEPGDPGPDAQAGWYPVRWEETGPVDPERWQAWDEPDGPAATTDADSMEHDLRVQVERRRPRRKDRPRDEARAAEQDAAMRLALEQMRAERKAKVSDEEFMQRGDRKVATIAPILYRETSVENLFPYLPESGVVIGRGPAGAVHYTATTPDLALGQGNNRGVMIEIDAGDMTGRIDFSKPGAEVLAQSQRQAEVIVSAQDYELGRNIRSFTVRSDAEIKKVDRFRFNRVMRDLEAKGWTRSEGPNGVTMTRPGASAAPPEPAPTITTDAAGQVDFAAPTGAQVRTALERRTEGGIRPTGPQRAPGEDGGLFDTRDTTGDMLDPPAAPPAAGDLFDGVAFRLDEEGDVVNPADLLAEFDADAAFLKNIKDCL